MLFNHPVSWLRGTYEDVMNRNGKKSKKLELTAAGLPVLSAMAYPNPANAKLHRADMAMNTSRPIGPDLRRTPRETPRIRIGTVNKLAMATSATMWPMRMP